IPAGQDFVLVLTKAHSTPSLKLPPDAPVLTLQNGLGNVEILCSLIGSARVLAGTTAEAATLIGEGHTRHVASGLTRVGAWTSCPRRLRTRTYPVARPGDLGKSRHHPRYQPAHRHPQRSHWPVARQQGHAPAHARSRR